MRRKKLVSNILLLLAAIVWGFAFAFQRAGADFVGPLTFVASRYILTSICLLILVLILDAVKRKKQENGLLPADDRTPEERKKGRRKILLSGCVCGCFLFGGSIMQQAGLSFTTAGKAAFITAMYLLLVPIFGLFLRHKVRVVGWIGIACGAVGMYFLCITESFTIGRGDFIVLIGAVFWACHVLFIDHFLKYVDPVKLAWAQFTVCAVIATVCMFIFEDPSWAAIKACAVPIIYAGVMSGAVGFTLQIIGQKNTAPSVAVLLLSLESVFGVLGGVVLLHETLAAREILGCILLFAAVIVAQLPEKKTA